MNRLRNLVRDVVVLQRVTARDFIRWKSGWIVSLVIPFILLMMFLFLDTLFTPASFTVRPAVGADVAALLGEIGNDTILFTDQADAFANFALDRQGSVVTISPIGDEDSVFAAGLLIDELQRAAASTGEQLLIQSDGIRAASPPNLLGTAVVAVIIFAAYSATTLVMVGVTEMRKNGSIVVFGDLPTTKGAVLAALSTPRILFVSTMCFCIALVGRALGFVDGVHWPMVAFSVMLLTVFFAALGLFGGAWFKSADAAVLVNQFVVIILLLVSGLILPEGLVPQLDSVAKYSPLRFGSELLQDALTGNASLNVIATSTAVLGLAAATLLALAPARFVMER